MNEPSTSSLSRCRVMRPGSTSAGSSPLSMLRMMASETAANSAYGGASTPSRSATTATDSGTASSATTSNCPPASTSSRPATRRRARSSMAARSWARSAVVSSERTRFYRGGSRVCTLKDGSGTVPPVRRGSRAKTVWSRSTRTQSAYRFSAQEPIATCQDTGSLRRS
ncbi:hypothetical protein QR97_36500 [Streptomyces sp. PBH53]|nr:hypothetical protein QR97_36500 [Streptomyces sp. PBH53]